MPTTLAVQGPPRPPGNQNCSLQIFSMCSIYTMCFLHVKGPDLLTTRSSWKVIGMSSPQIYRRRSLQIFMHVLTIQCVLYMSKGHIDLETCTTLPPPPPPGLAPASPPPPTIPTTIMLVFFCHAESGRCRAQLNYVLCVCVCVCVCPVCVSVCVSVYVCVCVRAMRIRNDTHTSNNPYTHTC
jgi:hypothetical protein